MYFSASRKTREVVCGPRVEEMVTSKCDWESPLACAQESEDKDARVHDVHGRHVGVCMQKTKYELRPKLV